MNTVQVSPFLMNRLQSVASEGNRAMLEATPALAYTVRCKPQKALNEAPAGSYEGELPVATVELEGSQLVVRFWQDGCEVFLAVSE